MKAITILQPWASLIAYEEKQYETRSWATNYRGPIAIHAGKKPVLPWFQHEVDCVTRLIIIEALAKHRANILQHQPLGAIIATAELVGCWPIFRPTESRMSWQKPHTVSYITPRDQPCEPGRQERAFGDWTPGRYAWELANVKLLDKPIPARGQQGLWNWEESR